MRKNSTSSDESLNDFASRNDGKTWQTVLDQLTNKAIKDGFINEIKKEPGLERKMKRIMESASLRYDLKIILQAFPQHKFFVSPLFKEYRLSFIIILLTGFNRKKLSYWISQCSESQYGKSGPKATKLRDEGNHKFRAHDNDASLRLYTEVKCTEFSR